MSQDTTDVQAIQPEVPRELSNVEICVAKKFASDKFTPDIKLRDICHQVANLLYDGTYTYGVNGILGSRQQLRFAKNKLKESKFTIILPDLDYTPQKHSGGTCSGSGSCSYSRDIKEMMRDLKAMVTHASREGVLISIA